MKKYIILITSLVIGGLFFTTIFNNNSNNDFSYSSSIIKYGKNSELISDIENSPACTDQDKLLDAENTYESQILSRLSQYEVLCNSKVAGVMMIFIDTPVDEENARMKAETFSEKLLEFWENGIEPLVVFEPVTTEGFISYREIIDGDWDNIYSAFYSKLKDLGINDQQMGQWVHLPESNTPIWNFDGTGESDFGLVYNKLAGAQKKYFPHSKATVLLNSQSYEPSDTDWANGVYKSFDNYLENIDRDMIDSFGIQGLPWVSPKSRKANFELLDPKEFININLAIEAAENLELENIWINTGTFGEKYSTSLENARAIPTIQRKQILDNIIDESLVAKDSGYNVMINLFSEDKSGTNEDTNWTYLGSQESEDIFVDFVSVAHQNDIDLSLFDKSK